MSSFDEIRRIIDRESPDKVILLTDSNVEEIEKDLISKLSAHYQAPIIVTPAGEENKGIGQLLNIVEAMEDAGATRRSMLVCIGGGMTTDIGGFAAAIFKRGIRHINVATTLLGAVDASIGGKTGIDYLGLKNELGAFKLPVAVLADPSSFASLPPDEILSGWGEVVKTAYITDAETTEKLLSLNPLDTNEANMTDVCRFCREAKEKIVDADPTEKGLRKILNFGHTAGHAIESLALEKGAPMPHGSAVAHGILVALILSNMKLGLSCHEVSKYATWLRNHYPPTIFTCQNYPDLLRLASHDKKNSSDGVLNFVLLRSPGDPVYDIDISEEDFRQALDLYQELQGR